MIAKIIAAGKKLAELNPNSLELHEARKWFAGGCRCEYANHDFDVLNGLVGAITRIENGW